MRYTSAMDTQVTIVRDFDSIRERWVELLTHAVTNKVFLHPVYQQTWWETIGQGELEIITVEQGGELVGIAPFFIHEQTLRFVGCKDVTDYLDIIVHPGHQQAVYVAVVEHLVSLFHSGRITQLELCSIPQSSPTLDQLPSLLRQQLPMTQTEITQQDVCPQIKLPSTFEEYLTSLDRKQRHEVRRKWRKLENEAEIRFTCVSDLSHATQSSDAVQTFIRLHQLSTPDKHDFWNDHHRAFFEALLPKFAQAGWLKLFFLEITDWRENTLDLPLPTGPVAAMLVFDYDNTYNLYNSGYDPAYAKLSTGQVLTSYTIQHAVEAGRTMYDFLRGDEEYKFRLGGIPLPVMDIQTKNLTT